MVKAVKEATAAVETSVMVVGVDSERGIPSHRYQHTCFPPAWGGTWRILAPHACSITLAVSCSRVAVVSEDPSSFDPWEHKGAWADRAPAAEEGAPVAKVDMQVVAAVLKGEVVGGAPQGIPNLASPSFCRRRRSLEPKGGTWQISSLFFCSSQSQAHCSKLVENWRYPSRPTPNRCRTGVSAVVAVDLATARLAKAARPAVLRATEGMEVARSSPGSRTIVHSRTESAAGKGRNSCHGNGSSEIAHHNTVWLAQSHPSTWHNARRIGMVAVVAKTVAVDSGQSVQQPRCYLHRRSQLAPRGKPTCRR